MVQKSTRKLVMGPGQKCLTRVGSAIIGLGLGLENSPKNPKFFNFFPSGQKKIALGQFKKHPGQRRVGLLFKEPFFFV